MSEYDAIVVGAGHNGLTTAALLAKRGRKVLVLERNDVTGGMAAEREFHPGYRGAGLFHEATGVRESVLRELELEKHGLRPRVERPDVLALGRDGESLMLHGDRKLAAEQIAKHSSRDGKRYGEYHQFLDRIRPVLQQFLNEPPLDLVQLEANSPWDLIGRALRLRRLGSKDMLELLRLPPMCVGDWLGEWFETDLLKAALALPAVAGTFMGPRSPGSNLNLLLHEAAAGPGLQGGGPSLVRALENAAREHGVEIRTNAPVEHIIVRGGSAQGVTIRGGDPLRACTVALSCDPKHALLDLLPPGAISFRLVQRIQGLRTRGTTAQVLLALSAPPRFAAASDRPVELARTGADLLQIERAFDAVKYRATAETPVLDVHVPTVARPELAPPDHAVMSVLVHFVPQDPDTQWNDAERQRLGDRVVELLEPHVPGLGQSVVAGLVLDPGEIESYYGTTGGHIHHGEHAVDQLLIRPAPECIRYATPVAGLYLCGSGSHPGGGLTCAPGALAARAIR